MNPSIHLLTEIKFTDQIGDNQRIRINLNFGKEVTVYKE